MLALSVESGDYIMIGEKIVVQVIKTGEVTRIAVDAPREFKIERGKHIEAQGKTPECIQKVRALASPPTKRFKAGKSDRSTPI